MKLRTSFLILMVCHSPTAFAANVTVDPSGLDAALDAASPGDTLLLESGSYGDVTIRGHNAATIVVRAAPGADVRLRSVRFVAASLWTLREVRISPSFVTPYEKTTMVSIDRASHDVTVADCELFSVPDDVASTWGASDWANVASNAIGVSGPRSIIDGNDLKNVAYGISVNRDTPNVEVRNNRINAFSRDGLRGIGDYGIFENNFIINSYDVDDHHDDFFQSWSHGADGTVGTGEVTGVVLRGNTFIGNDGADRPFKGPAQGIGCFDGFFVDWVVENNVVIVDHWHGITFLGARNIRIVNNTVIDREGGQPGPPWIQVANHKDGRRSTDIVIRNNLTTDLRLDADTSVEDHNLVIDDLATLFVDPASLDLHLLAGGAAVDTGSANQSPTIDHDGRPRPYGAAPDIGAYEWQPPAPRDGGVAPDPAPDAGSAIDAGEPTTDGGEIDAGHVVRDAGVAIAPRDGGIGEPEVKREPPDSGCSTVGHHSPHRVTTAVLLVLVALALFALRRRPHNNGTVDPPMTRPSV